VIDGTLTHYTFTGTGGEEFRVALGDVLTFDRGKVGRVVAIEEGEWRFSRAPKLRLTLETESGAVTTLLHPNQPEYWPATVRDSVLVEPVSNRYKLGQGA